MEDGRQIGWDQLIRIPGGSALPACRAPLGAAPKVRFDIIL